MNVVVELFVSGSTNDGTRVARSNSDERRHEGDRSLSQVELKGMHVSFYDDLGTKRGGDGECQNGWRSNVSDVPYHRCSVRASFANHGPDVWKESAQIQTTQGSLPVTVWSSWQEESSSQHPATSGARRAA